VQRALETKPDICLLDLRMPGGGVAAAWETAARLPTTKIVVLTVSDDDASLFAALRAGTVGYLVKDLDLSLLPRRAPRRYGRLPRQGSRSQPPAARVAGCRRREGRDPALARRAHGQAVPRERPAVPYHDRRRRARDPADEPRVGRLAALADGLSTREIGRRLQLKQSGVRAHISALVRKLGVKDRKEAIAFFRETTG
jgi:two-component system NarL family response regulator